jgi:hypothetical protein
MWLVSPFATVTHSPLRWFIGLLAIGALLLAGCSSDDDTCIIADARVMQANSVFRVFAASEADCFDFQDGLFGPTGGSASPTRLCFSQVQAETIPPTGRFTTTPDSSDEPSGEGVADGAASCNYTYTTVAPGTRVPCPFCDIIVNALNINPGGQGNGEMELHLALARTPETIANPLRSDPIPVTVGTNAQCDVTSINGVTVVQDTAN